MSWFLIVINLSLLKAAVTLVASGSTASNGSSGSVRLGEDASVAFQSVSRWEQWIRREIAQQGRRKLYTERRLISSTPCCHSASANTANAKWCPSNTVPPLECPPGCPECSPMAMQQKCSCWQVTSSNVDDQHQQQPCSGQLSSGNIYSTMPWGMPFPSDPLVDTLGLLGSYPNSSDPNQGSFAVTSLLQSSSLKNYCCSCTYWKIQNRSPCNHPAGNSRTTGMGMEITPLGDQWCAACFLQVGRWQFCKQQPVYFDLFINKTLWSMRNIISHTYSYNGCL